VIIKSNKKENYAKSLTRFLPKHAINYVVDLIIDNDCHFKISAKRKTKLGDYRFPQQGKGHRISVNGDLNKYGFLITTIHEFAHLITYQKFKHKVLPHGKEWKNEFKLLFQPVFDLNYLPTDITLALSNYLKNAKASSCTDDKLMRVLKRYNKNCSSLLVEELKIGDTFKLNNKRFVRGKKLRKYYLCREIDSNRDYKVLGLAEISIID